MEKDTRERKQNKNKEKKRKTNPGQNCSVWSLEETDENAATPTSTTGQKK
jgi:hypothetical protein